MIKINEKLLANKVYSTEEMFTGKYLNNGKKVYRKIFFLEELGNDNPKEYILSTNAEFIVRKDIFLIKSGIEVSVPASIDGNITNAHVTLYVGSNLVISVNRDSSNHYSDFSLKLILEYTKTTD